MRKGQSSITALAVASARALSSSAKGALIDPEDGLARLLLPAPLARLIDLAGRPPLSPLMPLAMRANFGLVDHVALRTAMIDRELERAIADGIDQVVIVGAGLDSRAHRLPWLSDTTLFELDHPASQLSKRKRAEGLPRTARAVRYVELDLEHEGLAGGLAAAGYRGDRPACFILEGLLMYLPQAVVEHTLRAIAEVAANGSWLLCTYATPDLFWLRHARPFVDAIMRVVGEPFRTALRPDEMSALLERNYFTVQADSDTFDWARLLAPDARRKPLLAYERLARARKV